MLNDLDNNESILLLYLADELPASDRTEVERMLSRDAAMRDQLDALRADLESAQNAMQRIDELTLPPVPDVVAIRQATRLLKQWQEKQWEAIRQQYVPPGEPKSLRFAWWSYPLATAAAIAVALLVWWTNLDNLQAPPYYAGGSRSWGMGGFMGLGLNSFETDVVEEPSPTDDLWGQNLEDSFDVTDEMLDEALMDDPLSRAEQELLAIWDRRSDFPDAWFVSDTENH